MQKIYKNLLYSIIKAKIIPEFENSTSYRDIRIKYGVGIKKCFPYI